MHLILTRAKLAFRAPAAEVVTLAVLAPHLPKISWATVTLAAQAVTSFIADRCARGGLTAVCVIGLVVGLSALALWPQASRITQTHATLQCAIAVMTGGASRLSRVLAWTVACEINSHLQCIFKSQRLDGERLTLLFRTTTELCFYREWHLNDRHREMHLFWYNTVALYLRFGFINSIEIKSKLLRSF